MKSHAFESFKSYQLSRHFSHSIGDKIECCVNLVNFGYSEKATKFEKFFHSKFEVATNFKWKIFFKFCGLLRISEV